MSLLPKITIAIASYNNGKYIERMILSALDQTYLNTEIIIVDDGSTDDTKTILNNYKSLNIYYKENGGLSSSRQLALEKATGEYICFVDADDYLDKSYIQKLYEAINSSNSDIAVCGTNFVDENGHFLEMETNRFSYKSEYVKEIVRTDLSNDFLELCYEFKMSDSWNKLYRIDFIKNNEITFSVPKGNNGTDLLFNHKALMFCPKVQTCTYCGYWHIMYNNSAVHRKNKNLANSYRIIFKSMLDTARTIENLNLDSQLFSWFVLYYREAIKDIFNEVGKKDFILIVKKEIPSFLSLIESSFSEQEVRLLSFRLKIYYALLRNNFCHLLWVYHYLSRR